MLIYISMVGWVAMVALFRHLSYGRGYKPQNVSGFTAFVTFAYIIFWAGMRTGVADTAEYIDGFNRLQSGFGTAFKFLTSRDTKAPGFYAFNAFFKTYISENYQWWLMTIAVIVGLLVMITLHKKSENFMFSAYLFITMLFFFWMLNGMRQFIAAAIIFYFYPLIEQRKTVKFIIVVLLCALIHSSCLIMIPIYFFVIGQPWSLQSIIFIGVLMIAIIFVGPFMDGLESALGDSHYATGMAIFRNSDDGVHPLRLAVALVPVAISLWKRKQISAMDNKLINVLINMSVVTAALYLVGVFTSGIMVGRLPLYTELGNLILVPFLLKNCFDEQEKKFVYTAAIIGYFAYFWFNFKDSYYISDITGLVTMKFISAN